MIDNTTIKKRGVGRPRGSFKLNNREHAINFRFTEEEFEMVQLAAHAVDANISQFIRSIVLAHCREQKKK